MIWIYPIGYLSFVDVDRVNHSEARYGNNRSDKSDPTRCKYGSSPWDAQSEVVLALITESYSEQLKIWPATGQHIMAQFDDGTIIVYQAYRPAIGRYAVQYGRFGGDFSFSRMSWIKPNFLWMMYRSGWGTKPDQEVTLALRVRRKFFDSLLAQAVPSTWDRERFAAEAEWSRAAAPFSLDAEARCLRRLANGSWWR